MSIVTTDEMAGVFYSLRFADGVEPEGFLPDLSKKIEEHPERNQPTRRGLFERMRVFSSAYNDVLDDESVQTRVEYLFLVEGNMGKLDWLVSLLEEYGTVSFPLEEREWRWSSESDIHG